MFGKIQKLDHGVEYYTDGGFIDLWRVELDKRKSNVTVYLYNVDIRRLLLHLIIVISSAWHRPSRRRSLRNV